jgi:ABC-type transport system involved in multi-copper enzyme maturation permease subunit
VFLAAVDVFGGLFRAELAERTLHHVFLQPLRRETVTIGKYLAGVLSLLGLGSLSWLIVLVAWLAPHGPAAVVGTLLSATGLKFLLSHVLALALALLAYGGLFLLAGMLARGPVVVGVMVWVWELLAIFLPTSFKRFTVAYWFNSLLPLRIPPKWMLAQEAEPATALAAVVVCVGFGAACTAVAAWWARHLQLSYGARD